jgi:hypothetical protein
MPNFYIVTEAFKATKLIISSAKGFSLGFSGGCQDYVLHTITTREVTIFLSNTTSLHAFQMVYNAPAHKNNITVDGSYHQS